VQILQPGPAVPDVLACYASVDRTHADGRCWVLANMVGGNVKALLPEPCRISLPAVADGMDYRLSVPGARPVTAVTWTCGGEPLMVRLLKRRSADSAASAVLLDLS